MQDVSAKQQTKQKYKPNHLQTGVSSNLALPIRGKTNKQKLSTNLTVYQVHTNHWTNFTWAETKRKKELNLLQGRNSTFLEALEKEKLNTISLKKIKKQRNTAQMMEQTGNIEVSK